MSQSEKKIWFPAKRYGWGWGFPITWQGWVVLLAWIAAVVAGVHRFQNFQSFFPTWAFVIAMIAVLIGVCWIKGEKPKWRWGDSD